MIYGIDFDEHCETEEEVGEREEQAREDADRRHDEQMDMELEEGMDQ